MVTGFQLSGEITLQKGFFSAPVVNAMLRVYDLPGSREMAQEFIDPVTIVRLSP